MGLSLSGNPLKHGAWGGASSTMERLGYFLSRDKMGQTTLSWKDRSFKARLPYRGLMDRDGLVRAGVVYSVT